MHQKKVVLIRKRFLYCCNNVIYDYFTTIKTVPDKITLFFQIQHFKDSQTKIRLLMTRVTGKISRLTNSKNEKAYIKSYIIYRVEAVGLCLSSYPFKIYKFGLDRYVKSWSHFVKILYFVENC